MEQEFHRIRRLPPYVFAEVNAMKARARAEGADIIDFGMGNPDQPTPPHIVEKLIEAVRDPKTHRYSTSRGIPGLRKAIAGYYGNRFKVDVDPETETIVTLGSKEGLANLSSAITNSGDVILVPNPSYPIHQFGFIIAGAAVRSIPVEPEEELLSGLKRAVQHSTPKPKALVLNYPNNPTTRPWAWTSITRSWISASITASISSTTSPIRRSISTNRRRPSSRSRRLGISPSSSPP